MIFGSTIPRMMLKYCLGIQISNYILTIKTRSMKAICSNIHLTSSNKITLLTCNKKDNDCWLFCKCRINDCDKYENVSCITNCWVVCTLLGEVNTKVNVLLSRERILMGSTAENKSFLSKRLLKVSASKEEGEGEWWMEGVLTGESKTVEWRLGNAAVSLAASHNSLPVKVIPFLHTIVHRHTHTNTYEGLSRHQTGD